MKLYDFHHPDESGDPLERDEALWDLLGKSRHVEVSPLFSRNVLRQVRVARYAAREPACGFFFSLWLKAWRPAVIGAAGLAVVALDGLVLMHDAETFSVQHADVEAIRNLDELLAYEPTDVWLDKSVY